ncbi:MAG: alkaline phosphatase D family protein [Deltaproteobacteria bacterium]|nr:alkaline phosphatase D family protein [Deltaproteobacteria bacterium]MBW2393611.1 alkaline phosphatase D family protein [Deltaproteobacteria bacterium]
MTKLIQFTSGLTRRSFLKGATGAALAPAVLSCDLGDPQPGDLFTLGVVSGEPSAESVVLWTRLAPDPLNGGGLSKEVVQVRWEVALDPGMGQVVQSGSTLSFAENGHAVHIQVRGLEPDQWYWYRFRALDQNSRVGRTRTFPAPGQPAERMRFALASCQNYTAGFYAAYRDMAEQDLDFVVHVGDYIYESGASGNPLDPTRNHLGSEIFSVEDYRNRYALYRLDPQLQDAHAALPFVVTWDDHEVDNDYAAAIAEEGAPFQGAEFLERRGNAYQVYAETMPLRAGARFQQPGGGMRLHRTLSFGDLAVFHMLDTRQYRTDQPAADGFGSTDPDITPAEAQLLERIVGEPIFDRDGILHPEASMLGHRQEAWLAERLGQSRGHWNVLAQQVMMMRWNLVQAATLQVAVDTSLSPADRAAALQALSMVDDFLNMDAWDGARAAQDRMRQILKGSGASNPVVLTGDVHSAFAANLLEDVDDPASDMRAAEFVCTSISSTFAGRDPRPIDAAVRFSLNANPHIEFFNGLFRGYCICDVDESRWETEYRGVGTVADAFSQRPDSLSPRADSPVETDALISIQSGFNEPDSGIRLQTLYTRI